MKKNSRFLIIGAGAAAVLAVTALAGATLGDGLSLMVHAAEHSEDCEWHHYQAIEATREENGSKEYWVCCHNHETVFEAPTVGTIVDSTHQEGDLAFARKLDKADPRYTSRIARTIDFDSDLAVPDFYDLSKSTNIQGTPAVEEGVGVNGTKGLHVKFKAGTDSGLWVKGSYLDLVFSNPEIKALEFDAKGDAQTSNWRHKNGAGSNITYMQNINGTGLDTNWQRFSFTRAMYQDLKDNGKDGERIFWGSLQGNGDLYLDNLAPVTKDMKADYAAGTFSLDAMNFAPTSLNTQDVIINDGFNNSPLFKFWVPAAGDITNVQFDTQVKSEGLRSIHITKKAGQSVTCYFSSAAIDLADATGVTFDILTTTTVTSANLYYWKAPRSATGESALKGEATANKWCTFSFPLENLRDTGNQWDGLFAIDGSTGKAATDIYIDNIRLTKNANAKVGNKTTIMDFEDVYAGKFDGGYTELGFNNAHNLDGTMPYNKGTLRDYDLSPLWIQDPDGMSSAVEIDDQHVSEGSKSLRVDVISKTKSFYMFFNKTINSKLVAGDKILFDVYSACDGDIKLGRNVTADPDRQGTTIHPNEWTTVTITKKDYTGVTDNGFRLTGDPIGSTGSFWIDNVRFVKA